MKEFNVSEETKAQGGGFAATDLGGLRGWSKGLSKMTSAAEVENSIKRDFPGLDLQIRSFIDDLREKKGNSSDATLFLRGIEKFTQDEFESGTRHLGKDFPDFKVGGLQIENGKFSIDQDYYLDDIFPGRNKEGDKRFLKRSEAEGQFAEWYDQFKQARSMDRKHAAHVAMHGATMTLDGSLAAIGGDPIEILKRALHAGMSLAGSMARARPHLSEGMNRIGQQAEGALGRDEMEQPAAFGRGR